MGNMYGLNLNVSNGISKYINIIQAIEPKQPLNRNSNVYPSAEYHLPNSNGLVPC